MHIHEVLRDLSPPVPVLRLVEAKPLLLWMCRARVPVRLLPAARRGAERPDHDRALLPAAPPQQLLPDITRYAHSSLCFFPRPAIPSIQPTPLFHVLWPPFPPIPLTLSLSLAHLQAVRVRSFWKRRPCTTAATCARPLLPPPPCPPPSPPPPPPTWTRPPACVA